MRMCLVNKVHVFAAWLIIWKAQKFMHYKRLVAEILTGIHIRMTAAAAVAAAATAAAAATKSMITG
jgi:hypothetical protein